MKATATDSKTENVASSNGRVANFSPGPSALPVEVLSQLRDGMLNCEGTGMSVFEMSHRGKDYDRIHMEAINLLRETLNVPENFEIILPPGGGATLQFAAVPMNILGSQENTAAYAVTGQWSEKALGEGQKFGRTHMACNSKAEGYRSIPDVDSWSVPSDSQYLYYCSNETVNGVEFPSTPYSANLPNVPLVADACSNLCTRPIDKFDSHGVIFASTQKNIGVAGAAVCLVRKDCIGKSMKFTPTVLDYQALVKTRSIYNTPCTFGVYVMGVMLKYLKEFGGMVEWDNHCRAKSALLYDCIDNSEGFYANKIEVPYRSRLNVPFEISGEDAEALTKKFLAEAKQRHQLVNLEGHRLVGGLRASLYTGMAIHDVERLSQFMKEFALENSA